MAETMNNAGERDYAGKVRAIADRLLGHEGPVFVAAHEDPDGDAIGSVLGLSRALRKLGKDVRPVAVAPRYLQFLPFPGELLGAVERLPEGALLAALDAGDAHRVVGVPVAQAGVPVLNVDHHGTNSRFGEIALVEPAKAAAALIIKDVVDALGVAWDAAIATPVLTGIITDTGSFRFSSTGPDVLRAAAELVEAGADIADVNEQLGVQPRNYFRLQAEVLSTVEYVLDGLMVMAHVNDAMLARAGASWEEVESLVGVIRSAEGTRLAALFKDRGGVTKLSLRSRAPVSAQNVAVACGGGGHVPAAGATMPVSFVEARARVLEAARHEFERVGLLGG